MATPNITHSTIDFRRGLPEGLEMFDVIEDQLSGNATRHPFGSILFIALCAMLCGMEHCEDFVGSAKAREVWVALNLLKTETAKPREPIRGKRIFAALDPAYLESII